MRAIRIAARTWPSARVGGAPRAAPATISYSGLIIASTAGTSCASNICSVVVGQQLTLTGSPSGGSWSIAGTTYNQWNGQDGNAPTAVNLSSNPVSFFWVAGGSFTVSYSASGATASVTFNVAAPTVSNVTITPESPYIGLDAQDNQFLTGQLEVTATVAPPSGYSGSISWLQVIPSTTLVLSGGGVQAATCSPTGASPWLDGSNPSPFATNSGNDTAVEDQPNVPLLSVQTAGNTLATWQISFNLYLLWQPTVSGTSFAVPLEIFNWSINAGAAFANSTWTANGTTTPPTPSPTTAYPPWSSTKVIGGNFTCTPR